MTPVDKHTRHGGAIFFVLIVLMIFPLVALSACQSAYYAAWERLGREKRHLLKDEVENVRADQEKASEEFKDVLTRIKTLYGFSGGDLETVYENLKGDYEDARARAEAVGRRIDKVERIASDLFDEWEREIAEIDNPAFKRQSRDKLTATRRRYQTLETAMHKSEAGMTPVLKKLHDYVLYLKHNLNAMALGTLKNEADSIGMDINRLVADMNRSIREADTFLKTF